MREFVLNLVLKRLVNKTKGYSTDKMLSYYGSLRERVYANLMLIIIALFSTVNYGITVGFSQWSLFVVLGVIIVGLAVSVFFHAVLYLQVRNYLNFMFKSITDDLEHPENYFERLLPVEGEKLKGAKTDSVEVKSEPSEPSEGTEEEEG